MVALVVALVGLATRRPGAVEAGFFVAGTVALWLATTTWSGWVWDHVPLMRFLCDALEVPF